MGKGTPVALAIFQCQQQELGLFGLCAWCGRCPLPQGLVCGGPGASVSPGGVWNYPAMGREPELSQQHQLWRRSQV